jgi:hypothetical protein
MSLQNVHSGYVEGSSDWDSTYTTVSANSATWNAHLTPGAGVKFWAWESDDEDFDKVVVMLPFNGPDGNNAIQDHSRNNHHVNSVGNAQQSTTQTKFGSSSLVLDGTGDYISVTPSTNIDFGMDNFTIELWYWYDPSAQQTQYGSLIDRGAGDAPGTGPYWFAINNVGGTYYVGGSIDTTAGAGSDWDVFNNLTGTTTTANAWHHFAFCRDGINFYTYHDGVAVPGCSGTSSNALLENTSRAIIIGARQQNGLSHYFGGHIDDVRVTWAVSRYPGGLSFTVPSSAGQFKQITT